MTHLPENARRSVSIPDFASFDEEAAFWETHDFTEFWDDLPPGRLEASPAMRARVLARLASQATPPGRRPPPLAVDLDPADRAALALLARERGLHPATLVQSWIEERLEEMGRKRGSPIG